MLKGTLLFILGLVTQVYTTFVLTILWNWFVVPVFHVSDISFWLMYGLILVVNAFYDTSDKMFTEERCWKSLMTAIDAYIPEDRRESVKEELELQSKVLWL